MSKEHVWIIMVWNSLPIRIENKIIRNYQKGIGTIYMAVGLREQYSHVVRQREGMDLMGQVLSFPAAVPRY